MNRCPPGPTRTATPFPSTRFFRSPDWFGGDHRLVASGASLLAHDRCRPPCPAAAGAHPPGARRLDDPDCLSHDAGRFVLAAPAPSPPRNLAAPAALAAHRQRSVLARFLTSHETHDGERLAPALLHEFRRQGRL